MAKADTGIVNIRGKQYKTVALRVGEFREQFPINEGWGIETQIYHSDDTFVVVRAVITDPEGRIAGTGYAEERRGSTNINTTSALENAETSAIGRSLAACGFAGTEYASADEVASAISQQAPPTRGLSLTDKFAFGKYSGQQVRDIVATDVGYCEWLQSEAVKKGKTAFDTNVLKELGL